MKPKAETSNLLQIWGSVVYNMRIKVLTTINVTYPEMWCHVLCCTLLDGYQHFEGKCYLHLSSV
jgi:hypothetical protein